MITGNDKTEQEILNLMNGSAQKQYTEQEVLNIAAGYAPHQFSEQELLNNRSGNLEHGGSFQKTLFNNLKGQLGLTGSDTKYTTQELLNLAYTAGVSLNQVLGGYLLYDKFTTDLAAGAVNGTNAEPTGGVRTVTDTLNGLSITGGQLVKASAVNTGVSDPGIWWPLLARRTGQMLLIDHITGNDANYNFCWYTAVSGTNRSGINIQTSSQMRINYGDSSSVVSIDSSPADVLFYMCVIQRTVGYYYFIKSATSFPKWTLLWISTTGNGANMSPGLSTNTASSNAFTFDNIRIPTSLYIPTPLAFDTFTRANGALGSTEIVGPDSQTTPALAWTGSTWTISSNIATNHPNYGSELVLNGDFTTDTSNWTASGATLASVAGGQSGNALQVTNSGAAAGYAYQAVTTVIGQHYLASVYFNNGTGGLGGIFKIGTTIGGSEIYSKSLSSASFSIRTLDFRATSTTTYLSLVNTSTVASDTTLFDIASLKSIPNTDLFASIATSTANVLIGVDLNASVTVQGLVLNLDSATTPQNFVIAYVDNSSTATAILAKGVWDGSKIVYTTVISGTVTFSSGATLQVIKDGTNYQLFYNNAKVGSTSTISDSAIVNNTLHGLYNPSALTGSTGSLDNFSLFPRGTANEYNQLNSY